MKRTMLHSAALALLSATAFTSAAAQDQYRCAKPTSMIDQRACAKAEEGPDALRRFVSRTQAIWNLYYWDYAKRDEPLAAALATVKSVAPAKVKPTPR